MALTKITGQVINDTTGLVVGVTTVGGGLSATDGFFSGIVTAVGDASFSGNVSVGGTLTYEDVTNIDAVGLVTARNGVVVGSGITLSKDGDIFATGVTTSTTFVGNLTGNVTGNSDTATNSTNSSHVLVTDNESTNENNLIPFIEDASATGNVGLESDGDLTYNPSTGTVTATKFVGDGSGLTGIGGTDFIHSEQINNSGITTSNYFVPTAGQLGGRRNLIINGAMQVAQRGTSSGSTGYQTVDRFKLGTGGTDEALQQYQGTIASHESPYAEGHRYNYYIMNGNQTSTNTGDYAEIQYKIEAQDMAQSGWNYTSSSSFITLSFWLKSNVSQNYYGFVYSADGTAQRYIFETGTVVQNSWNKIVVKIPGNSNVQFDNNVNEGLIIKWIPFYGTDYTNNSATPGSWANYNGAARCPDMTSTWWTTDNSTFYIAGVQLEVGPVATPFEHRSFGEELQLCKRYFNMYSRTHADSGDEAIIANGFYWSSSRFMAPLRFDVPMRTNSWSLYKVTGSSYFRIYNNGGGSHEVSDFGLNGQAHVSSAHLNIDSGISSSGDAGVFFTLNTAARIGFDAEL